MSKHTPGPWHPKMGRTGIIRQIVNSDRIVTTWNGLARPTMEEGQANARLIAAAPDLIEACEIALAIAEDRQPGTWDDIMLTMRAAIAKARGD